MPKLNKERDAAASGPGYPYFSKVIDKGLRILGLFTPETPSLSLKDITLKTGINPASAFRFVETLIQLGYLKKDPRTKLVKLGPMALAFSHNVIASFDLLQIIKPFVDEAFEKFNVTIDSGVIEDGRPVVVYRREARDTLVFKMPVAASGIMHCTALTKAILAWLPEEALAGALDGMTFARRTPHTLTSRAALLADLRRTRERGYSINNEEFVVGLISLGAPLIALDGTVIGAVSFDISTVQFTVEEAEKRFAPALLRLVEDIRPMLPR
jgi:IclR family pca regulon transcriptional regulator